MTDKVNNPAHYGGADNQYETIKVLKAWLTPQEYAGFLKGNALKYLSRHRSKNRDEDVAKASWYQREFESFVKSAGHDSIYGRQAERRYVSYLAYKCGTRYGELLFANERMAFVMAKSGTEIMLPLKSCTFISAEEYEQGGFVHLTKKD